MILLGITGPIGHGKTTLADMLAELEPSTVQTETSVVICEVVNELNKYWAADKPAPDNLESVNQWLSHLPAILEKVVHKHFRIEHFHIGPEFRQAEPEVYAKLWEYLTDCQQNEDLVNSPITAETKPHYRAILQWLGGYGVTKLDPGIWYDELLRRSKAAEDNGCRLFIIGGVRFLSDARSVRRAGGKIVEIIRQNTLQIDTDDPTEQERSRLNPDVRIDNNGTLADLRQKASRLLEDLKAQRLQSNY
jgi:hypothetical protein